MSVREPISGEANGPYQEYWPSNSYNQQHINEIATYPQISEGDTVFAIDWIQGLFAFETPGLCIYANPPSSFIGINKVGFFKMSSELENRPLYIFMPENGVTETVQRLKPSYTDIESNIDGYYDKDRECIVLTGRVDLIGVKYATERKRNRPPIFTDPAAAFDYRENKPRILTSNEATTDLTSMVINILGCAKVERTIYEDPSSAQMIIQLEGCAKVESTDPTVVGEFIGTKCDDNLLESYNAKKNFGEAYQGIKTQVWNILPGPIAEEINASFDYINPDVLKEYKRCFRDIESNIGEVSSYIFNDDKQRTDFTYHNYSITLYGVNGPYMKLSEFNGQRGRAYGLAIFGKEQFIKYNFTGDDGICHIMDALMDKYPHLNRTPAENMKNFPHCLPITRE